jgi:O-succinylbenzoic acid--CoA ligase
LYVLDRRDDLIISGGENVYPAEIEAVLRSHPAVEDVGVVGAPDEKWGQAPAAFIVLRIDASTTEAHLREFCGERLARYKIPAQFIFVETLPRNAAGKLLRRELIHRRPLGPAAPAAAGPKGAGEC